MAECVVKRDGGQCEIKGQIVLEKLNAAINKRVREIASKANLPGFRKGRVPDQHIRNRHGTSIRSEVVQEMTKASLDEVINEHKMTLIQQPEVHYEEAEDGADTMKYIATFETLPDMPLTALSKLSIKGCDVQISQDEVDEALTSIQTHFAQWEDVKGRKSQLGDRVLIDYLSLASAAQAAMSDDNLPKNQLLVLGILYMQIAI